MALEADASVLRHLLSDLPGVAANGLTTTPVHFIDTAGAGYEEETKPDGASRLNPAEADLVRRKVEALLQAGVKPGQMAVIAPKQDVSDVGGGRVHAIVNGDPNLVPPRFQNYRTGAHVKPGTMVDVYFPETAKRPDPPPPAKDAMVTVLNLVGLSLNSGVTSKLQAAAASVRTTLSAPAATANHRPGSRPNRKCARGRQR